MSFRTKILLSIAFFMCLVLGLITVNLLLDARRHAEAEKARRVDFQTALLTRLMFDAYAGCDWASINRSLATSDLATDWKVASFRPPESGAAKAWVLDTSSRTTDTALTPQEADRFRRVFESGASQVDGRVVTVPFTTRYNESFVAELRLKEIDLPTLDFAQALKEIVPLMGVAVVLLLLVVYVLLNRLVLAPLNALADASRRVASGDLSHPVPELDTYDEMHQLVRAFNDMMQKVEAHQREAADTVKKAEARVTHTERRLLVAQRLSTTGTLAAGIAHEINNPLGGMINAAEGLRGADLTPEQRAQYLELIVDGLGRVKDIVGKILHFTPRDMRRDRADLRDVVERALALVRHRAREKNVALEFAPPAQERAVLGDAAELQQAILNLVINAIDAVEPPRGRVWIDLAVSAESVRASIHDNGRGMTETQLSQCLDPFYTTKDVGAGSGLGLKVAHSIVTQHGGDLYIESSPDVGTTVTIALPAPSPALELHK